MENYSAKGNFKPMYKVFFGLKEKPFKITPDPAFFFMGTNHQDALNHLLYGISQQEGFTLVTGHIGTGKTILCRTLIKELNKEGAKTALILNPSLSEIELLKTINEEFELGKTGNTKKAIIDRLNHFLLEQFSLGKNVVLIIDEAQNLQPEVLEGIRLLSNLETEKTKLIQIVLFGQLELESLLDISRLKQLKQRIAIRYRLKPLAKKEINNYINHRLMIAGSSGKIRFTREAFKLVYKYSSGIPRLINLVCEKALLSCYVSQSFKVTGRSIKEAIKNIEGVNKKRLNSLQSAAGRYAVIVAASLLLISIGAIMGSKQGGTVFFRPDPDSILYAKNKKNIEKITNKPIEKEFDSKGKINDSGQNKSFFLESFTALLRIWGIENDSVAKGMIASKKDVNNLVIFNEAKKFNLEAISLHEPLERIKKYGYPCMLRVKETCSQPYHIALIKLNDMEATVVNPKKGVVRYTIIDLKNIWLGDSIIFWRNLDGITGDLLWGMRGAEVEQIQKRFKEVGYFQDISPTGYFGNYTQLAVRDFQGKHGLEKNGIVGNRTKMVLYRLLAKHSIPGL